MRSFAARYAAPLLALAALAKAQIVPTAPWGSVVCTVGQDCEIQWNLDTTGQWKSFDLYLNSGPNSGFVQMATVATGLDGTTGDGKYTWKCPDVTPNAAIYFFSFAISGQSVSTWTTRFTIAAADGSITEPENSTQPDGSAVPWGVGTVVGGNPSGGDEPSTPMSHSSRSTAVTSSLQTSSNRITTVISTSNNVAPTIESSSEDETVSTTVVTVLPTSDRSTSSRTSSASPIGNNANVDSAGYHQADNVMAAFTMLLALALASFSVLAYA